MAFVHCTFCLKGQHQALIWQCTCTHAHGRMHMGHTNLSVELTIILASASKMMLLSEHKLNVRMTRIDLPSYSLKTKPRLSHAFLLRSLYIHVYCHILSHLQANWVSLGSNGAASVVPKYPAFHTKCNFQALLAQNSIIAARLTASVTRS